MRDVARWRGRRRSLTVCRGAARRSVRRVGRGSSPAPAGGWARGSGACLVARWGEEFGGGFAAFGQDGEAERLRGGVLWGRALGGVGEGLDGLGLGGGFEGLGSAVAQAGVGFEAGGEPGVVERPLELGEGEAVDLAEVEEGVGGVEEVADEVGGAPVGRGITGGGGVGMGRCGGSGIAHTENVRRSGGGSRVVIGMCVIRRTGSTFGRMVSTRGEHPSRMALATIKVPAATERSDTCRLLVRATIGDDA